jgi:hypothetical protein
MESELGRVVDALPGLIWTAWCEYTGAALTKVMAGGERDPPLACSNGGDPFQLPASDKKRKRVCGASTECITGSTFANSKPSRQKIIGAYRSSSSRHTENQGCERRQ